jgi:hypothetical protein
MIFVKTQISVRVVFKNLGLNNGLAIALIDPFGRAVCGECYNWNIAVISL